MTTKKTTEEVANKVRAELTKEKLLKQIEETICSKDFRIISNHSSPIQLNKYYNRRKT
jgi:hypothetical protein|tara:strand:- start:123 stop:296 length:174 start_codon:yes stop_codon:yes gene_type:complete